MNSKLQQPQNQLESQMLCHENSSPRDLQCNDFAANIESVFFEVA